VQDHLRTVLRQSASDLKANPSVGTGDQDTLLGEIEEVHGFYEEQRLSELGGSAMTLPPLAFAGSSAKAFFAPITL
jgi:hypothetical protein